MKTFNLKGELLTPHPQNESDAPGRTIIPPGELLRHPEPGWARPNYASGETVHRREGDIEQAELDAAREWLAHVEAGRIG